MTLRSKKGASALGRLALQASPLALIVATSLSVGTTPALAQSNDDSGRLGEVVITARYRQENIQTTPIAITAFSSKQLEMAQIQTVEDLGLKIPNAFFRKNISNYGPTGTIGLRGLNQTDFSYAFDPAVGVYIDDIYHSTLTGSDMDIVDLQRVEVLRGPQGTLFGVNSIGGAIRLISKKPQGDNSGSVEFTYGRFNRADVKAIGDVALVKDKLFLRMVGVEKHKDGNGAVLDYTCQMIKNGTPQLAGMNDGIVGANMPTPIFARDTGGNLILYPGPFGPPAPRIIGYQDNPIYGTVGSKADNNFALQENVNVRQDGSCKIRTLGGLQHEAGRAELRFVASDRLEINVNADYQRSDDDPNYDMQISPVLPAAPGAAVNSDQTYDHGLTYPLFGVHYVGVNNFLSPTPYTNYATMNDPIQGQFYDETSRSASWGIAGTVDYKVTDNVSAKLIGGYRNYWTTWASDSDRTPFPLTESPYRQHHDQYQAELRLSGTLLDAKLEWTTGLFYFRESDEAYNTTEFGAFDYGLPLGPWNPVTQSYANYNPATQTWAPGITPQSGLGLGTLPNFIADDLFTTKNKSAFVHLIFHVTDRISASAGLRYTDVSKTNTFQHYGQIVVPTPLLFGQKNWDWSANVSYQATDDVYLYAQAATGHRSEGATPRIFTAGQLGTVPAEKVLTYEIGAKTEWFDKRLRVNLDGYYSNYNPRAILAFGLVNQCSIPSDPNPTPYFLGGGTCPAGTFFAGGTGLPWFYYTSSPGKLKGAELEVTAEPIDGLNINYTFGYTTYSNDNKDPTSVFYRDPSALLQPKYNMSAGVQYTFPVFDNNTLTPRMDWSYQSHMTNGSTNLPNKCPENCIPSYNVFNGRLTYSDTDGKWSASFQVTNLFNKFYWQQLSSTTSQITGLPISNQSGVPSRPREWSFTIKKEF